ncbi:protein kinase [Candidatus Micrarchaeota archaeon]|nr:protein kinase [Candidatus Micrarchaeota archaeon]
MLSQTTTVKLPTAEFLGKPFSSRTTLLDRARDFRKFHGLPGDYTGKTLCNRYTLGPVRGKGGMGVVYGSLDKERNEKVAVKLYTENSMGGRKKIERILNEADILSGINHENIVNIRDSGRSDGVVYIVMDYLEGRDLSDLFTECLPCKWEEAKETIVQVCAGLEELHKNGIVHKDVKPANIIVTNGGTVKLIDFDISEFKFLEEEEPGKLTRGYFLGTINYASPEEASGRPFDHRADIYSVGVILYEMVCGTLPFVAHNEIAKLQMRVHTSPLSPSKLKQKLDIPRIADEIIMKALGRKPEERFQSMGEMAASLKTA